MQGVSPFGDHFVVKAADHLASRALKHTWDDAVNEARNSRRRHAQTKTRRDNKMLAVSFADIVQMLGH